MCMSLLPLTHIQQDHTCGHTVFFFYAHITCIRDTYGKYVNILLLYICMLMSHLCCWSLPQRTQHVRLAIRDVPWNTHHRIIYYACELGFYYAHTQHTKFFAHSLCCFASSLCFATCPYHESTTTAFHKVFRWKSTLKHWASRFFSSLWSLGSCLIQYVDRFFPSDHIATRKRNDSVALQHGLRLCAEGSIVQTPGYLSTTPNFSSRPIEMWRSWCNMWGLQPFWALTSSQAKCGKTCPPKHFELFHAPPTRGNPWKEWCNPIMSGINR